MRAHGGQGQGDDPGHSGLGVPTVSVAISAYLEPTLWYDVSAQAARTKDGRWSGSWTPPKLPDALPSLKQARRWLATEPLAGPWTRRLDQVSEVVPDPRGLHLLRLGPRLVLDVAGAVTDILREHRVPCALIGSSGVFLQRAFRLSADVDLSLPTQLSSERSAALARSLDTSGVDVRIVRPTYLFGVHRATGVSIDIEAGTAYRQPLDDPVWERVRTVNGLPVMDLYDLLRFKSRLGRDKDVCDAQFLATTTSPE